MPNKRGTKSILTAWEIHLRAKKKKGKSKPKPPRGKPKPEWKGPAYAWATLIFGACFGLVGGCTATLQNDGKAGVFFTQGIELRHTAARTPGGRPEKRAKGRE